MCIILKRSLEAAQLKIPRRWLLLLLSEVSFGILCISTRFAFHIMQDMPSAAFMREMRDFFCALFADATRGLLLLMRARAPEFGGKLAVCPLRQA